MIGSSTTRGSPGSADASYHRTQEEQNEENVVLRHVSFPSSALPVSAAYGGSGLGWIETASSSAGGLVEYQQSSTGCGHGYFEDPI